MRKSALQKGSRIFFFIALLVVAGIVTVSAIFTPYNVNDYYKVDVVRVLGSQLLIGTNCTAIVATTSPDKIASIQNGIDGRIDERPNTHDIFSKVMESYNITLDSVLIQRKDEKFYYSDMIFSTVGKTIKLDSLPSDGIALALRTKSTIYINKTLLKEQGTDICSNLLP